MNNIVQNYDPYGKDCALSGENDMIIDKKMFIKDLICIRRVTGLFWITDMKWQKDWKEKKWKSENC